MSPSVVGQVLNRHALRRATGLPARDTTGSVCLSIYFIGFGQTEHFGMDDDLCSVCVYHLFHILKDLFEDKWLLQIIIQMLLK